MQALKALKTRTALLITVGIPGDVVPQTSRGWSDRTKKAGIVPVKW